MARADIDSRRTVGEVPDPRRQCANVTCVRYLRSRRGNSPWWVAPLPLTRFLRTAPPGSACLHPRKAGLLRLALLATAAIIWAVFVTGCDELSGIASTAGNVAGIGHCWSEGEKFNEVTDDDGDQYPVKSVRLPAGDGTYVQGCGVERGGAVPTPLPERSALFWTLNQGFFMPSGKPVYVGPKDTHQKYWVLAPGRWFWE